MSSPTVQELLRATPEGAGPALAAAAAERIDELEAAALRRRPRATDLERMQNTVVDHLGRAGIRVPGTGKVFPAAVGEMANVAASRILELETQEAVLREHVAALKNAGERVALSLRSIDHTADHGQHHALGRWEAALAHDPDPAAMPTPTRDFAEVETFMDGYDADLKLTCGSESWWDAELRVTMEDEDGIPARSVCWYATAGAAPRDVVARVLTEASTYIAAGNTPALRQKDPS